MMEKEAREQDPELNKAKAERDAQAGLRLHLNIDDIRQKALEMAVHILAEFKGWPTVVVTGGAGSGKTTFSKEMAIFLGVKHLDFDTYIPGGYTPDKNEYERRFNKGLYEMWEDVPPKQGWVIEHVESCNEDLVGLYRPEYAILLDPGEEWLSKAVEARGNRNGLSRALQSSSTARSQFRELSGEVVAKLHGLTLKKLES
jgi:adenosyl cobinamide kinase/adenosyl cobinamide phosphate guanylyltransferase